MTGRFRGACLEAAKRAAGGVLGESEVMAAFERIAGEADRLRAAGRTDRFSERLADFAKREGDEARLAAAIGKRNAMLTAMRRAELAGELLARLDAGLSPKQALLSLMEGSQAGVSGARNSVGALTAAYEARYVGGLMRDLHRELPAWRTLLADRDFDRDLFTEMWAMKDGGTPAGKTGSTGNPLAAAAARIFSAYAELARVDLNRNGANIRKLGGWAGGQMHDGARMLLAGREDWIEAVLPRLDLVRTFGRAGTANVREALGAVFEEIVSGVRDAGVDLDPAAGARNGADLAKALSKSRVLHFKSAEDALSYRQRFGQANTTAAITAYLRGTARAAAVLERFGPNPEATFTRLVSDLRRDIAADRTLSPREKAAALAPLRAEGIERGTRSSIQAAFDIMTGAAARADHASFARIGGDIRALEAMSKLGGALFSSMAPDTVTAGLAASFRGSGFLRGIARQVSGVMRGRPKGEQAELAFLLGEGFDGLIGHIAGQAHAEDLPVGRLSRLQETFFKLNGLSWWTDVGRSVAARNIAAELGMRAGTAFADLPAAFAHALSLQGIDGPRWEALRRAGALPAANGRRYLTPDLLRDLPDEAVDPLIQDRLAAVREGIADAGERAARERALRDEARRGLELDLLRFVADETSFAVVETDAASRRIATMNGLRPGTLAGEAARFVFQFKGFPVAFTQRIWGRALHGFDAPVRGGSLGGRIARRAGRAATTRQGAHIAALILGTTIAGYMATVMNDLRKGRWPPRDPTDPKTWAAAMVASGGLGIYGDFLLGETNRNGSGVLETLAGPTIGTLGDLLSAAVQDPVQSAMDERRDAKPARLFDLALQNTPGANLWWLRPALDVTILNAAREWLEPGTLRKRAKRLERMTGQRLMWPAMLGGGR